MCIVRIDTAISVVRSVMKVLSPILWGVAMAYIMNPAMKIIEKYLKKIIERKKPHPKLIRTISVTVVLLIIAAAITALTAFIVPAVGDSIENFKHNYETYSQNIEKWVDDLVEQFPEISATVDQQFDKLMEYADSTIKKIYPGIENIIISIKDGAWAFLVGIKDFVLGLIVMVYLLSSKERFKAQLKKCVYSIFRKKTYTGLFTVWHKADSTFSGFMSGKIIDSIIIGLLCYIIMKVFGISSYPELISLIIGVTNIVPFFGPIVGAIPGAFLILLDKPHQFIGYVVFVVILQQFDGNILGPKILGDSTGLPAFWVMFAILVGGGLFGFPGMILGVPALSVIFALTTEAMNRKLEQKHLPTDTDAYYNVGVIKEINDDNDDITIE